MALAQRTQEATMGLFSKDIKSLEDLYKHGLQDLYYAENQIVKALPKMIENAANAQLKQGLQQHFGETQNQVKRLEQVFKLHKQEPEGTKCPAIDGIIKEGDELMGEVEGEDVMNVGIVAAAQAVEHYEITRYGALIAWAKELEHDQDAAILARSLEEEKAADRKLTTLAERRVNPQADAGGKSRKAAGGSRKRAPAGRKGAAKSASSGRRSAASRRKAPRKTQRSRKSGRA
jgi:ferritin-like metal-binding protein YciE